MIIVIFCGMVVCACIFLNTHMLQHAYGGSETTCLSFHLLESGYLLFLLLHLGLQANRSLNFLSILRFLLPPTVGVVDVHKCIHLIYLRWNPGYQSCVSSTIIHWVILAVASLNILKEAFCTIWKPQSDSKHIDYNCGPLF